MLSTKKINNRTHTGVRPKGTDKPLSPRQQQFIEHYYSIDSPTFGNCYKSAIRAGYKNETARNLTHNRPAWLSEKVGQLQRLEPEDLLLRLTAIIDDPTEPTNNKLKAIDMMMKSSKMYSDAHNQVMQITIESILD